MFFHISDQPQENYSHHWNVGGFHVSTDSGWQLEQVGTAQVLYKGYADDTELANGLMDIVLQTTPRILGNFCALVVVDRTLTIQTDRYRSFPIYIGDHAVNNLIATDHTAWTDSLITVHADLAVTETKFDLIGNTSLVTSTVDQIDDHLSRKIQAFLSHNKWPLKVFLSGGVDTLLIYSYIVKFGAEHEMIWGQHTDYDDFYLTNHDDIQSYWGYRQIHHWQDACVLASGAPGDEFMLRSPVTANQYLLNHDTSMSQQLKLHPDCLHRDYFNLSKHALVFEQQQKEFVPSKDLVWDLCNTVANDWQHWHIGNTLTWTPLRDLELFKMCLALPYDQAIGQIVNSAVSCELIERNVPGLTRVLSDQKNTGNFMRNLRVLLNQQC
jgi:hypothetical protein